MACCSGRPDLPEYRHACPASAGAGDPLPDCKARDSAGTYPTLLELCRGAMAHPAAVSHVYTDRPCAQLALS